MPAIFPALSFGDVWLAPATRTLTSPTEVIQFLDDTEQRWQTADPLNSWVLVFPNLLWADVLTLGNFFYSVKGAFDPTWTLPFAGVNYLSMVFDQDEITPVENDPGRYAMTFKIRQVAKSGTYASGSVTAYPSIRAGVMTQRPYTTGSAFLTTRNDLPSGARYSYAERDTALRAWTCEYSVITEAEVGILLDFFCKIGGRYGSFTFHDADMVQDYPNCRLDMDALQIRHLGAGQYATTLSVVEFRAAA